MSQPLAASNIFDLTGAVALVTGGGTGLGLIAALALATNGAKVYITGRRKEKLDQAVNAHSQGLKGSLVAIQGDVGSKDDLIRIAAEVEKADGKLHVLINNAGVEGPVTNLGDDPSKLSVEEYSRMHLENESVADWDALFRVNTHAVFFATMAFLPLLSRANAAPPAGAAGKAFSASVINITSISGIVKMCQNHYAYNASKAAANHITQMMSHELRFRTNLGLRFNAIAPGLFASEMTTKQSDDQGRSDPNNLGAHANPAGRGGQESEFAGLVLLLASNAFMTGQVVAVDGGFVSAVSAAR
ncbi:uncharacterized protein PFL1_06728 [Pseudozyma flocculosa PF-1]|uniref:Related to NAD(P)H-dependent oxidoreductase n=2 Tax=Pseudozyma flocculosa TaxID=84751 RepID=A0A5C3F633_9BASI|nr:uncharacterized protein PFL1_06728 [Pseudozyma flocculosa PF-1]EPQ25734.1 hypothetical protein PFL1_06728 [Pseudozyma flocculosa PF-1]SPO38889.1 related to NAD(P)H-dependent oxidoreductase [Pseudozyma flocculosa]